MNKANTILSLTACIISAVILSSCSTSSSNTTTDTGSTQKSKGSYSKEQFVGTWEYIMHGMAFIPTTHLKVENRNDGVSISTILKEGKAPKPDPKMKLNKLKIGSELNRTKWSISGNNLVETSMKTGKKYQYKIISVEQDKYILRNSAGTMKVYKRIK